MGKTVTVQKDDDEPVRAQLEEGRFFELQLPNKELLCLYYEEGELSAHVVGRQYENGCESWHEPETKLQVKA